MANVRKTQRELYAEIKALVEKSEVANATELVEFIDKKVEQLEHKSDSKKMTAKQTANAEIAKAIVERLSAEPNRLFTITEIIKEVPACAELTNQRVSAIVRGLIGVSVERVEEKRKAYFRYFAE